MNAEMPESSVSHNGALTQEPSDLEARPETVWEDHNLLTFDGGGVRGYWSLLAMKRLMDIICELEMSQEPRARHSFYPQDYPEHVSQVALDEREKRYTYANDDDHKIEGLDPLRRYLPCHYFDLIGGTSTGALIAIMLGRFRMSILDCLHEYESIGSDLFGRNKFLAQARMILTKGTRFNTDAADRLFQGIVHRRRQANNERGAIESIPKFPTIKGTCHTFVTSLASKETIQSTLFIMRSYEYREGEDVPEVEKQIPLARKRTVYATTDSIQEQEPRAQNRPRATREDAHDIEIWQVARAATAVIKYWKPQKITDAHGEMLSCEDAALRVPNPTQRGLDEITTQHGQDAIGAVVSVGTAKATALSRQEAGAEFLNQAGARVINVVTDPEPTHEDVKRSLDRGDIPYFRLNPKVDEHRLNTRLDQWEPKIARGGRPAGWRTIEEMKRRFDEWYEKDPEAQSIFRKCAGELVGRRRSRVQQSESKWERYVTGCYYQCHYNDKERKFTFREDFIKHIDKHHPAKRRQNDAEHRNECCERSRCVQWRYRPFSATNGSGSKSPASN